MSFIDVSVSGDISSTSPRPTLAPPPALLKTPPLICEQGPSAPASPTAISPTSPSTRARRLCPPLNFDAMHRIHLLTTNFQHELSPPSPSLTTSDLGSSPRSSISLTPWMTYRDHRKGSMDLLDDDAGSKDLLSPGFMLSPAPYSPFSDCEGSETPYSAYARSPTLSPNPAMYGLQHFSFDQERSVSSLSNRHNLLHVPSSMSLDELVRERSRSDSDMAPKDDRAGTSGHSFISVPDATSRRNSTCQYKKRLLQKYRDEQARRPSLRSSSSPPPSTTESEADEMDATSSSTLAESGLSTTQLNGVLPVDAVSGWIESQVNLLNSVLLQVPNPRLLAPPPADGVRPPPTRQNTLDTPAMDLGPIKGATLWRRSRSETDVSRQQPIAHNFPSGVFTCSACGAGFSCHDRLAKHIASRHRDRSSNPALDEDAKVHKCTQCTKKFARSDMLTRHMRLHTGAKPYECAVCGQVFSRSDHLSTHQRTHTGEKPYQCSKCSYTASRRDMITRHFRTHDLKEGEAALSRLSLVSPTAPMPPGGALFPVSPGSLSPNILSLPTSPLPISTTLPNMLGQMLGFATVPSTATSKETPTIGSGVRSAFTSPNHLAPPTLQHSLSVPSSPIMQRQGSLTLGLSRQPSIGGFAGAQ